MCHITTESSQELERRKRRNTRRRVRLRERGERPVMKTFGTRNNTTSKKKLIPQAKYSDWSIARNEFRTPQFDFYPKIYQSDGLFVVNLKFFDIRVRDPRTVRAERV